MWSYCCSLRRIEWARWDVTLSSWRLVWKTHVGRSAHHADAYEGPLPGQGEGKGVLRTCLMECVLWLQLSVRWLSWHEKHSRHLCHLSFYSRSVIFLFRDFPFHSKDSREVGLQSSSYCCLLLLQLPPTSSLFFFYLWGNDFSVCWRALFTYLFNLYWLWNSLSFTALYSFWYLRSCSLILETSVENASGKLSACCRWNCCCCTCSVKRLAFCSSWTSDSCVLSYMKNRDSCNETCTPSVPFVAPVGV